MLLFFSAPGSVPVNFLKALLNATKNSNVTHIKVCVLSRRKFDIAKLLCRICFLKVQCPDPPKSAPGEACQALTDHRVAVRVGGVVKGLTTPTKGYDSEPAFVTDVLK